MHRPAGGQCKRTNIGIALVSDPRVLFLDEPTSGLDSYTANEVLHCFVILLCNIGCRPEGSPAAAPAQASQGVVAV